MNSRDLIDKMNVDRHHEQAPSGFAQFVGVVPTALAVYALIVLTFSL
jgi:hypothetical protein